MNRSHWHGQEAQRGMALVISLIFLLLLTLIGLSSMQSATVQEKMAGSVKQRNESFQIAEAALRAGETAVQASTFTLAQCTYCLPPPESVRVTAAGVYSGTGQSSGTVWVAANSGFYLIQNIGVSATAVNVPSGSSATLYRVTAVGLQGNSRSVVESVYAKY